MEEKRRLPSWMVGASTNKVIKPLDADASSVLTSDEAMKSTKPKAQGVTRNHEKKVCLSSDKNLLVKCETKRKKKRLVEKDAIECHDPDQEVDVEKRKRGRVKRKVEESESLRKKSYEHDSGNETQGLSCDEEDDDLTMDDVLSIAKEFVENDNRGTCQQKPSEVKSELRSKSLCARSPIHEETDSHHEHVETTSTVTLADSKMTGDPAQDMLDLFLPLLKKPIAKHDSASTNDIKIPHETKNQQHAAVISDKPVITLTKRKNSLRDAVAMLLNVE